MSDRKIYREPFDWLPFPDVMRGTQVTVAIARPWWAIWRAKEKLVTFVVGQHHPDLPLRITLRAKMDADMNAIRLGKVGIPTSE